MLNRVFDDIIENENERYEDPKGPILLSTTSAEIAIILLASLIFLSTVLVVMSLTLRSRWDEIANPDRRKRERKQ